MRRSFATSPLLEARELDESGTAPPPVAAPVALARKDFADAVHRLLKDLHQRERVRRNPLVGSSLAATGPDPVDTLIECVRAAVAELATRPRLDLAARAIDRTFVRAAGSQEKAAELLGVPFSTYRRHLAAGIDRVDALLWDWELHGRHPGARSTTDVSTDRTGG